MARMVSLIFTSRLAGKGETEDPFRHVMELWSPEGHLVAEHDPWQHRDEHYPIGWAKLGVTDGGRH